MLDFRMETFLTLCEEKSFTKTAKILCITQPAVSQHIHYLEQYYGRKLFEYKGKSFSLTPQGEKLKNFALLSKADWQRAEQSLRQEDAKLIHFGATLTIGEYVMPPILAELLTPPTSITYSMQVDNTETLLQKLQQGAIEFAFVEGQFDKKQFTTRLLSTAQFIPVCAPSHAFTDRVIDFEEIFMERLIVREHGSGTRGVLEQVLTEHSFTFHNFSQITEIGNLNGIKELVKRNLGITFIYENAVRDDLLSQTLKQIQIKNFKVEREFNFICMKDSHFLQEYLDCFYQFHEIYHRTV
jgi:DNA-binding transcriptional LysR family regulator